MVKGFPGGIRDKELACQYRRRDMGSISGLRRSPGEGHGNPLQYSCLENHMDRGAWWAIGSYRVTELETTVVIEHAFSVYRGRNLGLGD